MGFLTYCRRWSIFYNESRALVKVDLLFANGVIKKTFSDIPQAKCYFIPQRSLFCYRVSTLTEFIWPRTHFVLISKVTRLITCAFQYIDTLLALIYLISSGTLMQITMNIYFLFISFEKVPINFKQENDTWINFIRSSLK